VAEVFAVDLDPHLFARIELECCRFTHVLWIVARAARCGYGLAGPDLDVGMGVGIPGFSPVAPVLSTPAPSHLGRRRALWFEEPGECGRGLNGDDALAVDPDALEELGQQLAAGLWGGLGFPEARTYVANGTGSPGGSVRIGRRVRCRNSTRAIEVPSSSPNRAARTPLLALVTTATQSSMAGWTS
jgi:hypothetical protein